MARLGWLHPLLLFSGVLCLPSATAGTPAAESPAQERGLTPSEGGEGSVVYRFVGVPLPGVFHEFETGPSGEESPCPGEVVLIRVVRVCEGVPPLDKEGLFRYRSLNASGELMLFPWGPRGRWHGLEYEFTRLSRQNPTTEDVTSRIIVRPLWSCLLGPCLLVAGVLTAVVLLIVMGVRFLKRKLLSGRPVA